MIILAIDLGKFNSMCCFYDTATQKYRFQTVETSRHYLSTVFKTQEIDLVVMEACGPSGWISDLCQQYELETLVCSTNDAAWLWKNVKRKTDKDDALKLARMAMLGQLTQVTFPSIRLENIARSSNIARNLSGASAVSEIRFVGCSSATASRLPKAKLPGAAAENSSIRIASHSPNAP